MHWCPGSIEVGFVGWTQVVHLLLAHAEWPHWEVRWLYFKAKTIKWMNIWWWCHSSYFDFSFMAFRFLKYFHDFVFPIAMICFLNSRGQKRNYSSVRSSSPLAHFLILHHCQCSMQFNSPYDYDIWQTLVCWSNYECLIKFSL